MEKRGVLGGLWISDKNSTGVSPALYRRCWPYHLAMKPFYHCAPQIWTEKAFYALSFLWRAWMSRKLRAGDCPRFDVVHAIMGYASEALDHGDRTGALKVVDCLNTHPSTYHKIWQGECDRWCPGEKIPVPRWMLDRMVRDLERADLVVVQSKFARETMIDNGIPADKVMINIMSTDAGVFRPRTIVPERPRFVCVGTICVRKGHPYLMRAFKQVRQRLPDAELICAGEYKCDFRKERPLWEGTFTHIPHLSHEGVSSLLRSATAFVFPSQEEGIARAQIEALACGVPVIGTHQGGATTVVDDGVEGFIVPSSDIDAIAIAMVRIATDRELNQRMGEAAFRRCAVNNTWQDYGDRMIAEYRSRLAGRAGADPAA